MLQLQSVAVPGNDLRIYLPASRPHKSFELTAIAVRYTSSAVAGARRIRVGLFNAADVLQFSTTGDRQQPENNQWWYTGFSGAPFNHSASYDNWLPWPERIAMLAGWYLRVWDTNNLQPGTDNIGPLTVQGEWA